MNSYVKGDRVKLFADFKDSAGAPAATTATITTLEPDGEVTVRAAANPSLGRYEHELTLSGGDYKPGVWHYRIEGVGAVERAKEGWFELEVSAF